MFPRKNVGKRVMPNAKQYVAMFSMSVMVTIGASIAALAFGGVIAW